MKLECIWREFPGSIHYQRCSVRIFSELSGTLSISNFSSPQNATYQQWGWCWFPKSAAFLLYHIVSYLRHFWHVYFICKEKESLLLPLEQNKWLSLRGTICLLRSYNLNLFFSLVFVSFFCVTDYRILTTSTTFQKVKQYYFCVGSRKQLWMCNFSPNQNHNCWRKT